MLSNRLHSCGRSLLVVIYSSGSVYFVLGSLWERTMEINKSYRNRQWRVAFNLDNEKMIRNKCWHCLLSYSPYLFHLFLLYLALSVSFYLSLMLAFSYNPPPPLFLCIFNISLCLTIPSHILYFSKNYLSVSIPLYALYLFLLSPPHSNFHLFLYFMLVVG